MLVKVDDYPIHRKEPHGISEAIPQAIADKRAPSVEMDAERNIVQNCQTG